MEKHGFARQGCQPRQARCLTLEAACGLHQFIARRKPRSKRRRFDYFSGNDGGIGTGSETDGDGQSQIFFRGRLHRKLRSALSWIQCRA